MKAYIEHAAFFVEDMDWTLRFFAEVFEMEPYRFQDNAGVRNYWLHGGLQLIERKDVPNENGRFGHLCLVVNGLEEVREKALVMGCTEMPKHHWVRMPDGLEIEMFEATEGAVAVMDALVKKAPKK